jgi:hypothetical protein
VTTSSKFLFNARPGSKARERGALDVAEFKQIARQVWPEPQHGIDQPRHTCPECGHQFKGNGFDGIDAHWRARHNGVMTYEEAWPLTKSGSYSRKAADSGLL